LRANLVHRPKQADSHRIKKCGICAKEEGRHWQQHWRSKHRGKKPWEAAEVNPHVWKEPTSEEEKLKTDTSGLQWWEQVHKFPNYENDSVLEFSIHEPAHFRLLERAKQDLKQGKRILCFFREFGIKAEEALFKEGWMRKNKSCTKQLHNADGTDFEEYCGLYFGSNTPTDQTNE